MIAAGCIALAVVLLYAAWRRRGHRPVTRPPAALVRAPRRRVRVDVPHALYHYLHAELPGRIYLGITNDPEERDRTHELTSEWYARSTRMMYVVEWHPSRQAALNAERAAVLYAWAHGEPIENRQYIPGRIRRRARR